MSKKTVFKSPSYQDLSRRERQIMDIIFRLNEASAAEVLENIPDPPESALLR